MFYKETMEEEFIQKIDEDSRSIEDEESEAPSTGDQEFADKAPRRSNRQPKKKKRNSSDSGGEEMDDADSSQIHNVVPLASTDRLIQVGTDFQAIIDPANAEVDANDSVMSVDEDRDEMVWKTPVDIDDNKLKSYVNEAVGRFRLPVDRALYILMKSNYDFDRATIEIGKRRQIRDYWSEEEKALFSNAFFHYGKKFDVIRAILPHRSMASIIQHYYDTKKNANYKTTIDAKLGEIDGLDDEQDEEEDEEEDEEIFFKGTCENCGERTDQLSYNNTFNRRECQPCTIYMKLMGAPRPSNWNNVLSEHRRVNVKYPERLRKHVLNYEALTAPATGDPHTRLNLKKREQKDENDCIIIKVTESSIKNPSEPYVVDCDEDDDPIDEDTCRMTRNFYDKAGLMAIQNIRVAHSPSIALVWRKRETVCMEDNEILKEETRKNIFEASQTYSRVNRAELNMWKQDMQAIKIRADKKYGDLDLTSSRRSRFVFSWTDSERREAIKLFHWYGDDFDAVSELLGTKSADQIKAYYYELGDALIKSIASYQAEMREKVDKTDIMKSFNVNEDETSNDYNVIDYIDLT